jgi:uncharacterized protein (TIGR02466 family)
MNHIVQDLNWSTPIWSVVLKDLKIDFNKKIEKFLIKLKKRSKGRKLSNEGGWQSEVLNDCEELKPLLFFISKVCENLNLQIKTLEIHQIWANINKKNDYNQIHQHGGYYHLSGTYYVKTPKNCGSIFFRDPRPSAISNIFFVRNYEKSELKKYNVEEGLLMLWPSYLDHFVEPSKTNKERISISFDIVLTTD